MLDKKKIFSGKIIEPLELDKNEQIKDFIDNVYAYSSYNARRLAEACKLLSKMIENDATICLTLAGAMTPIGLSGPIIKMMELGFIDWIISTGANIYHDLHRPYNYPVVQGDSITDDEKLNKLGIARIYDTFIKDDETLMATDKCIQEIVKKKEFDKPISSADFHYLIGKDVLETAPHPKKSFVAKAAELKIPVYTSAFGDSSIGMNLVRPYIFNKNTPVVDPIIDIIETTAIVRSAKKNGVIIIGGGSPKNFFMQTQPTLWQILKENKGGHDYFIQLTSETPVFGGLSGATPQEAKSWGKVKEAFHSNVVVYSCASITFPLLCQYAKLNNKPRRIKSLYLKKQGFVNELIKAAHKNKELIKDYKKVF